MRWILLRGGQLTPARHPHEEFASFELTHAGSRRTRILSLVNDVIVGREGEVSAVFGGNANPSDWFR